MVLHIIKIDLISDLVLIILIPFLQIVYVDWLILNTIIMFKIQITHSPYTVQNSNPLSWNYYSKKRKDK